MSILNQHCHLPVCEIQGRFIYDQKAGIKVSKKHLGGRESDPWGTWTNYRDHEAMYVYNLVDATTLRTGVTFFYLYRGNIFSLWANYSYERKEYYEKQYL